MSELANEETTVDPEQRPSLWRAGSHPVNVGHLVMGLAFLGLTGIWALFSAGVVESGDVRWLLPLPWVVAGAVGLVATTMSGAARRDRWGN